MNLLNQSREMKTEVETFVIEETAELIYDNEKLDQWNKHVAELGLVGQTKLVKPEKSPIPFLSMNQSLINICECLCPRKVKIEEYNVTPIPVEILDLVALSKREKYFDEVQIWYDEKSPDPFCVGSMQRPGSAYNWDKVYYLLGKWGDVKQSFEELKARATERYKAMKTHQLNKTITDASRELEDIDAICYSKMEGNGDGLNLPF